MKYNKNYRPKASATKKRNPSKKPASKKAKPKSKSKAKPKLSLDECIEQIYDEGGFTDFVPLQFAKGITVDLRKKTSECGELAINQSADSLDDMLALIDRSEADKARTVEDVKKNPRRNAKSRSAKKLEASLAKSITDLQSGMGIEDQALVGASILEVKDKALMLFPEGDEDAAFLAGIHQGFEIAARACPTAKIPGISLVSSEWREITDIINARKKLEKRITRQMGTPQIDRGIIKETSDSKFVVTKEGGKAKIDIAEDIATRSRVSVPEDPWEAYFLGSYIGMMRGFEACPLKWLPFGKGFKRVRDSIRSLSNIQKAQAGQFYMEKIKDA